MSPINTHRTPAGNCLVQVRRPNTRMTASHLHAERSGAAPRNAMLPPHATRSVLCGRVLSSTSTAPGSETRWVRQYHPSIRHRHLKTSQWDGRMDVLRAHEGSASGAQAPAERCYQRGHLLTGMTQPLHPKHTNTMPYATLEIYDNLQIHTSCLHEEIAVTIPKPSPAPQSNNRRWLCINGEHRTFLHVYHSENQVWQSSPVSKLAWVEKAHINGVRI